MFPRIEAIIFDLDNCLLDPRELGDRLVEPLRAAIRRANRGTLNESELQAAFADLWWRPFDTVADEWRFSEAMRAAGWRAYATLKIDDRLRGYEDLTVLSELPMTTFLVTSGFRHLQQSKINALGIGTTFAEIHIDAIDDSGRLGKAAIFSQITRRWQFIAQQVMVVGDSGESEIAAGNRLSMCTVQLLRSGVVPVANADYHVSNLWQLKVLLGL